LLLLLLHPPRGFCHWQFVCLPPLLQQPLYRAVAAAATVSRRLLLLLLLLLLFIPAGYVHQPACCPRPTASNGDLYCAPAVSGCVQSNGEKSVWMCDTQLEKHIHDGGSAAVRPAQGACAVPCYAVMLLLSAGSPSSPAWQVHDCWRHLTGPLNEADVLLEG
jgi:hypothetical protein